MDDILNRCEVCDASRAYWHDGKRRLCLPCFHEAHDATVREMVAFGELEEVMLPDGKPGVRLTELGKRVAKEPDRMQ
jgi:hypothetical protein